ncbi:trihelix transcription factor ENAP1 [Daucus carota subsp. sativus]|uniref:trihelix transcription factor ENAP1 n=1 Tax=Daucus carota subsp. sativus TaxID=79200 RepID=UPI0007F02C5B|nr:PREDICTED: trihelix transcription factor ASIL2-like [Daucus carota subsp. sativus]
MGDFSAPMKSSPAFNAAPPRATAFREDCWTEEATATLVNVWGRRYLETNRGSLRCEDWNQVALAVNERHGATQKQVRTDVQCKNRIDTIKKRFKAEKARVCASGGAYVSTWRFYDQLDMLIGQDKVEARKTPPAGSSWRGEAFPRGTRSGIGGGFGTGTRSRTPPMAIALRREAKQLPEAVAVTPLKRSGGMDDSFFRRNYSAMAAAAAKEEAYDEDDESEDEEQSEEERRYAKRRGKEVAVDVEERGGVELQMKEGTKMIAMAIHHFAETYEKVEMEKLRYVKEVEVKRIDAGKEVELKRMELMMSTQVQFEKMKRKEVKKKSSGLDDLCSS